MNGSLHIRSFSSLALVFLFLPEGGYAEDPTVLDSKDIPSVSEVLKEWTPLPKENPYQPQYFEIDYPSVARTIAAFEKHFPGLRYAVLGRDASATGWLLDSFYTQIGQPGRVIYLRGGGVTINGQGEKLADFIESAGFSLDPKKMKTQAPMVIIDRTIRGNGQVPQLIRVAHAEYVLRGGKAQEIAKKLMAFNFAGSHAQYTQKIEDPQLKVNGHSPLYLYSDTLFPEFLVQWHRGYGPLRKQKDGKWYGAPKALTSMNSRRALLGSLYEFLKNTGSPFFLERVQRHAQTMGYAFPLEPVSARSHSNSKIKTMQELQGELQGLVKGGQASTHYHQGLSHLAKALQSWLQKEVENNKNKAILALIPVLQGARENHLIHEHDLVSLMGDALTLARMDGDFVDALDQLMREDSRIKRVLDYHSDFFLQDSAIAIKYEKLLENSLELNSCYRSLKKAGEI